MPSHKICPRCPKRRNRLPLTSFGPSKSADGLHSYCRKCKREYDREWRKRRKTVRRKLAVTPEAREAIERSEELKPCKECGARKLLRMFPVVPRAGGQPAVAAVCKSCQSGRVMASRRKGKA